MWFFLERLSSEDNNTVTESFVVDSTSVLICLPLCDWISLKLDFLQDAHGYSPWGIDRTPARQTRRYDLLISMTRHATPRLQCRMPHG